MGVPESRTYSHWRIAALVCLSQCPILQLFVAPVATVLRVAIGVQPAQQSANAAARQGNA